MGMTDEDLHSLAWLEVSHGRQLVEELEQKLSVAPSGCLSMHGWRDNGPSRADLICEAAAIVSTFSNLISLLNSTPAAGVMATAGEECGEMEFQQTANSPACNSSSPISWIRASTSPLSGARSPSPQPMKQLMMPSSSIFCSKTPPQSPMSNTTITSAKRPVDQTRSLDSGLHRFDPTAYPEAILHGEEELNVLENSMEALSDEEKENGTQTQISLPKRRKYMPKRTYKLPASSNADQGNEASAPMDGHTWRKYGQKDILGSHHPRSYYRCTYKKQLGCLAIKYVQKSDNDPPVFHVTYKGEHTCQSKRPFRQQIHPYSTLPMNHFQDSQSKLARTTSVLESTHHLQTYHQHPLIIQTRKDLQLPILKNSTDKTSGNDVLYRPLPRFSVPEVPQTDKPEADYKFNYMGPNPKNPTGIIDEGAGNKSLFKGGFPQPNQTISEAQIPQFNEPSLWDYKNPQADQSKCKHLSATSANLGKDTSQSFKQILNQLFHPLRADENEAYESSANPNLFKCSEGPFSLSNSELEVVSNPIPSESLPISFYDSKSKIPLGAIAAEGGPPSSDQSDISEVVAENIPNSKFDLDFMLNSPDSQPMKELHFLLFD